MIQLCGSFGVKSQKNMKNPETLYNKDSGFFDLKNYALN
jgi:hypothetical protein